MPETVPAATPSCTIAALTLDCRYPSDPNFGSHGGSLGNVSESVPWSTGAAVPVVPHSLQGRPRTVGKGRYAPASPPLLSLALPARLPPAADSHPECPSTLRQTSVGPRTYLTARHSRRCARQATSGSPPRAPTRECAWPGRWTAAHLLWRALSPALSPAAHLSPSGAPGRLSGSREGIEQHFNPETQLHMDTLSTSVAEHALRS